ncbi:rhomboid family domain-containing protein [Ditylenchus destructor]|nr:rhomboid family domain-containing protein [Ditylenchus destructor]
MILFLVLVQFVIHFYRVVSGSCHSNETADQRCVRNWYHRQWGRRSSSFRYWAMKTGIDLEFDYGCYAVIIDPRKPYSMIYHSLRYFETMSWKHAAMKTVMECHNEEMIRGFCKNKRTSPMYVFDKCHALYYFGLDVVDGAYQVFFDYIKNQQNGINHHLEGFWNLKYYEKMDFLCSDSMPNYGGETRTPDRFKLQRYLTNAFFHVSVRELFYTALWQIIVGPWLEIRYGSLYVISLYIIGVFTGNPFGSLSDEAYDLGPFYPILAMSISLLIEVSLNAHYWRNTLAFGWYVLLNVIYYAMIFVVLSAIGNAWVYERYYADAYYHSHHVLATPFLSRSCKKILIVAIVFWPLSSIIFLKGNVREMKIKFVESLSDIWVDVVLCCWGRNLFIHRTSCECFYCKRNTRNYLRHRQKLVEVKARTQAGSAVSNLLESLAGLVWSKWGKKHENRPRNVNRTLAKAPSISHSNELKSEIKSDDETKYVQNKADEIIANFLREAGQEEAQAKELAKQRRDLLAEMRTSSLDPNVKAQMQKEIEAIEEHRKLLLESSQQNRQSADWTSQMLDH